MSNTGIEPTTTLSSFLQKETSCQAYKLGAIERHGHARETKRCVYNHLILIWTRLNNNKIKNKIKMVLMESQGKLMNKLSQKWQ
jgi:hypothetical protein